MVVKEQAVFNAANLALFMVNISQSMLETSKEKSVLDLKARYHGLRYAQALFKILPENTKLINIKPLFEEIPVLGLIHEEKILRHMGTLISSKSLIMFLCRSMQPHAWRSLAYKRDSINSP